MVICRFFLQGTCRFGTKCNNEHLDIKQLVKSDLEAAINGKQWPLSCFGPFKDKPSIPSFIEDHSFEEMRWLCYEAKQKNCLDQYVQYFSKEAVEANNKMKTLLQLSPQVLDLICRLYDIQADGAGNAGLSKNNSNNPFGLGSHTTNDISIFGKPGTATGANTTYSGGYSNHVSTNNTGTVFGSLTATPAGSVFGGGSSAFNQTLQNPIFSQQTPKTNSIFGGGSSQNGLFGQTQTITSGSFGQTPQTNSGLFGQQQQIQPVVSGSLFSQQAQQPQSVSSGGLFAQTPSQGAKGGSIFSQGIQQQNAPNSGNIFAQAQSQSAQNSSSFPMYQPNKQQTPSAFGQQNAFAQQNSSGMFGQMPTPAHANSTNNLFGQALGTTNANGIFNNTNVSSMPTQNIFAQTLQQQQHTPANIFSQQVQATANQPPSGFFQQGSQSSQPGVQQQTFGQQIVGNNSSQPLLQSPVVSSSVYSKLEDLTSEDIEAFKADTFTPGRIPNVPPPREFIN